MAPIPGTRAVPTCAPEPKAPEPKATAPDPRELDPRFLQLPAEVQALVRAGWRADASRDCELREVVVRARREAQLHGVLLLAPVHWLLNGRTWTHLAVGLVLGLAVGTLWARWRTGQVATPVVAAGCFSLCELLCRPAYGGQIFGMLCGAAFIAFCASYLGLRREMRVSE